QIKELAQKNAEENLNKYNLLYSAKLEATTIALSELSKLYQKILIILKFLIFRILLVNIL
ncbi:MAG: hypothetical protein Q8806_02535, partial [Candidatus Phytoplasma australasiaticum]|nr:hypothetical protein [Candidatus Phytoplasma australasiaticum]